MSGNPRQSPIADAYRGLRHHAGSLSILAIVECATIIARAEGHDDVESVLRRELGATGR